ncbi:MAG: hypothetical protein FJX75_01105 [Armatimonadetes bacterium]|nr:hypothetical protein [Armatimonadota bacterium]
MRALAITVALAAAVAAPAAPWWDDYPTTVQASRPEEVIASGADSALCGVVDDPCWSILGQRIRYLGRNPGLDALAKQGVKLMSWAETFGTCEEYAGDFQLGPDGKLLGFEGDPTSPRPLLNHWAWQLWQPKPDREMHWVGLGSYYADEAWLQPWTRTHPRYGAPPFRYPDGREAEGLMEGEGPFRFHQLYDAGCSQNVLGELEPDYGFNDRVNEVDPATARVRGPTEGLIPVETPNGTRHASIVSVAKDSACPSWIDYARASARHMVDCGVRGIWADNFSAWDSFGSGPVHTAFGEWSVARFREHLARRFTPEQLRAMGIDDAATFDVRTYLRGAVRDRLGGDDTNLRDPKWSDPYWLDDPIWREYRIYKGEVGKEALRGYHEAFHTAAREAGLDDFCIQGNDIPIWCFDWPRPEYLEMVSTEFAPGWNLLGGPRGIGLPPGGRIGPVIKMARVHARSRFVHVWYYLDGPYEKLRGNAPLGRVLSYELLAHHAMIQAYPGAPQVAGTVETHREVTDFIHAAKGVWGDREPFARIGLLYSPDSRLVHLTPGRLLGFEAQQHVFDLLGWGTALSELHQQYTVIPEWALTPEALQDLRVLLLPSVEVFSPEVVENVLRPWVEAGGRLIISGPCGDRTDASRSHARVENPAAMLPELCALASVDPNSPRSAAHEAAVGRGQVILLPSLGFDYYQQTPGARDLSAIEPAIRQHLSDFGLVEGNLPRELEVSVFRLPARGALFVDVANLDLNPETDAQPRAHEVTLTLSGVPGLVGLTSAEALRPGEAPAAAPVKEEAGRLTVGPLRVGSYVSLVLR